MVSKLETRAGALSVSSAALGATAAIAPLLRRMRREFESTGELSAPTTLGMYACYASHAAATALAARERIGAFQAPSHASIAVGGVLALSGAGLCVAGMSRFAGPAQISGTEVGGLASGGVYRYSRNPQYLGYIGLLAGCGVGRRSAAVLALAGVVALAFRWWIPVEERHLDREFGDAYRRYRAHVPRWLGVPFGRRRQSP